jgi:AraC-like DNA-binding protein
MRAADDELSAYFETLLMRALPTSTDSPLVTSVRRAIQDALLHGPPTIKAIARRLGVGQRTLQRRLKAQGVSYSTVLDATRCALADGYLCDPAVSMAEVAFLVGFYEQASFFKAMRRWHDTTPAHRRRALLSSV